MRVLVTGGAGFIGSHLVDALVARGDRVAVVDDLSTGRDENLNHGASFFRVDVRDTEALEQVFMEEQPEIVSHHAAQTDVRRSMADPAFDAQVNILGLINLLQLSVKYQVRKFVFASTSAVYPEQYLKFYRDVYGLRFTIFRYGNVYGSRQDPHGECGVVAIFSEQMLNGVRPTIFGDGSKTRDYIYVGDVVSANLLAMDGAGDGEVFNLGWGREITDFEVFEAVRRTVGVEVEPIYSQKRPGELDRIALDSTKAKRLLGWAPRVPFEEGVPLAVAYYARGVRGKG